MRTSAFAWAAVLAFSATAAWADDPPQERAASTNCVEYTEVPKPDLRQHDLHLSNTCSKPMACNVSWTVTCGKKTTNTRKSASLGASQQAMWVASASDCDDDWSIDSSWTCRPSQ